ncbi:hypothetical protein KR51_00013690 [Rubidibacter lacunae KORDI 51-2]|uniref:Uncharacterized protein n=1 Tax=Rubidibacter lacunae KORDI 51-2 TaxID=582515 RepID=U5DN36_9CHRO|nr:hypothetical protein [Rubidibacter lacunae]ERN42034.1 hypothetical protein KR51_00013690 [Rubidibacter lacunae KORDI 51-2]
MDKLANPLQYPLAVLLGGIVLVAGARLARLPVPVIVPVAAIVSTAVAIAIETRQPPEVDLENPELVRQVRAARLQAERLVRQAEDLREEAARLLTGGEQLELLSVVQYACDRASELPERVDAFTRRLHGSDSLLSIRDLEAQLQAVWSQQPPGSDAALTQRDRLIASLERNLALAREGQDARQAQVIALSTAIADAVGTMQELQNQLRVADLTDADRIRALRSLGDDLQGLEANLGVLVAR